MSGARLGALGRPPASRPCDRIGAGASSRALQGCATHIRRRVARHNQAVMHPKGRTSVGAMLSRLALVDACAGRGDGRDDGRSPTTWSSICRRTLHRSTLGQVWPTPKARCARCMPCRACHAARSTHLPPHEPLAPETGRPDELAIGSPRGMSRSSESSTDVRISFASSMETRHSSCARSACCARWTVSAARARSSSSRLRSSSSIA